MQKKTKFILFHTINKPIPRNLDEISVESMTIKRVNSFKYLGLTLDETLHWNDHVNELCKSLVKYFGIFNHIENKITPKVARQYYAFIFSRIKYGIEIYGSTSISNVNRLQVMQNKLLKLILKLDKFTSTNVLYRNMKILKIADVHVCNTLGVVNEMGSNRCPEIFKNYFKIKTNHNDLRTKNQMVIPPSRISLGDQAVRIKGASMWNKLDKDLLQYRFKTTLKQHLTQYYLKIY